MNAAQNDSDFFPDPLAKAVAGFEVAVADFERGHTALDEARYHLDRAKSQLEYAKLCVDESDAELEVVVMQFNASYPDADDYYALMAELDLASDTMMRNTATYESAFARHRIASDLYESQLASYREHREIACAIRGELLRSLQEVESAEASNDPHYAVFDHNALSDAAYRFYRRPA
jgi:hypothetical protein